MDEAVWHPPARRDEPLWEVANWLRATLGGTAAFGTRTLLLDPCHFDLPAGVINSVQCRRAFLPACWDDAARREGRPLPSLPVSLAPPSGADATHEALRREAIVDRDGAWRLRIPPSLPPVTSRAKWQKSALPLALCRLDPVVYRHVRRKLWANVLFEGSPLDTNNLCSGFARWRQFWEELPGLQCLGPEREDSALGMEATAWRTRLHRVFDAGFTETLRGWTEPVARCVLREIYLTTYRECLAQVRAAGKHYPLVNTLPVLTGEDAPIFILPEGRVDSEFVLWR